jgi:hypothetical protein
VIAKAKKRSDVKWRHLNARIKAAGEVGAPLHLKTKAYHMTWEVALSAGFPMEGLADILMLCRWYLTAIDPQGTRPTAYVLKEVTKKASQFNLISYSTGGLKESTGSRMHWRCSTG